MYSHPDGARQEQRGIAKAALAHLSIRNLIPMQIGIAKEA